MSYALLIIALQVAFVVHVVRTGRTMLWIWFIIFVPVIGCAAYFITQILPEMQGSPTMSRAGRQFKQVVNPHAELRQLQEQLEIVDTVENRLHLADAYVDTRMFGEAVTEYQTALKRIGESDPDVMHKLAYAEFKNGDPATARTTLDSMRAANPDYRSPDAHLLYARVLEALGETEAACSEYDAVTAYFPGEEARVRYALLLKKLGRKDKARSLFEESRARVRRAPRHYRRAQKRWTDLIESV
jgi:hypothetical protein